MVLKKADNVAFTRSAKHQNAPRRDDQGAVDPKASPNIGPERLICEFLNRVDPHRNVGRIVAQSLCRVTYNCAHDRGS